MKLLCILNTQLHFLFAFSWHSKPAVLWMWMWFPLTSVRESCFSSNITRSGRYRCMEWNTFSCLIFSLLKLCFQAIERGIYFEICYSPAIRGEYIVHTLKQWHTSCKSLWRLKEHFIYVLLQGVGKLHNCILFSSCVKLEKWDSWLQHYTGYTSYISDASARRHTLANALELVKATRGKVRMVIKTVSVQVPKDVV